MVRRATKTDIRDAIRTLHDNILSLKAAVSSEEGKEAVTAYLDAEDAMEELRETVKDRYAEAWEELVEDDEEEVVVGAAAEGADEAEELEAEEEEEND